MHEDSRESEHPVESEALEPISPTALEGPSFDGVAALGAMTEGDFQEKLDALVRGRDRVELIKTTLMVEDVHYGTIPGTQKPTLYQPGAQLLGMVFGLRATFVQEVEYGDGVSAPHIRCRSLCELHLGDTSGPIVGTGNGSANTWEAKHRWRRGDRACPSCGVEGSIIRSKYGNKGWHCYDKKGGCGADFVKSDPAIMDQVVGDVENANPYDLENTVIKVGEKRAYVGAMLRTTASSGTFTQDTGPGDGPEDDGGRPGPVEQAPIEQPQAKGQAAGEAANGPGDVLEVAELHQVRAMFPPLAGLGEGGTISSNQQGRLYNRAIKNGWRNSAAVDDEVARVLSMQTSEIPSIGDAYEAIVRWFQSNQPGGAA
jgi:hypothetical protein